MIGEVLSHYKVIEEIGRGGMGIVYRAVDLKLDRDVAIKVLPPELVSDEDRKQRFVQEAKAAAALHDPHIATIFEIDDANGVTFIAMELIEGDKLGVLLSRGGLPLERALEISIEIARGLLRAHGKGIVHRDLKPANIMVTDEGHAKIIDFGIAKLIEPLSGKESDAVTSLRKRTASGQIMGTVSYMSPEQARGREVDHRSDIFSFGLVLHELLAGSHAFERESGADTLSAILNEKPPRLPSSEAGSSELQVIVDRCLAKQPEQRYQTAESLLAELEAVKRELSAAPRGKSFPPPKPVLAVAAAALVAIAGYNLLSRNDRTEVTPLRLSNPVQITSAVGVEDYPTWSPDGRTLAYAATQTGDTYGGNWDLWVTQLGVGQPVNRTADHDGADRFPAWSPDGTQIAFWSDRDGGGYFVMSALGGASRKVTSGDLLIQPSPPQWSSDGNELACIVKGADGVRVDIVHLQNGDVRRVSLPGRKTERFDLSWSPDNRFFAYVDATDLNNDVTRLWVLRLEDGDGFPVTDGWSNDWSPSWSADSNVLFFVSNRGGSMDLWQQVMGDDGTPVGEAAPLTTGIVIRHAAFSPDGEKLAYSRGRRVANIWRAPILADRPVEWNDAQQVTFDQA